MTTWLRLAALSLLLAPRIAMAAPHCDVSATGIAFGTWTGAPLRGTGSVSVNCHGSAASYTISLSPGGTGTYLSRRLSSGTSSLSYNLYADSALSLVWGDGTAGSVTRSGSDDIGVFVIYGRIPMQPAPAPGTYTDQIIVTVTY